MPTAVFIWHSLGIKNSHKKSGCINGFRYPTIWKHFSQVYYTICVKGDNRKTVIELGYKCYTLLGPFFCPLLGVRAKHRKRVQINMSSCHRRSPTWWYCTVFRLNIWQTALKYRNHHSFKFHQKRFSTYAFMPGPNDQMIWNNAAWLLASQMCL